MPIYNSSGAIISKLVENVVTMPDITQLKTKTLGGTWYIQTIGIGATIANVSAYFKMEEKLIIDEIKKAGGSIKVTFEGRFYEGVIDELSYARLPTSTYSLYKADFTLLVNSEGVVS